MAQEDIKSCRGLSSGEFSNHACGELIAIQKATFAAGQIVQRYDPPRSLAGRMGGIRVKSWQAHCDLIIFERSAPQENGPSQRHWAKLPRRTSIIDDAAIGWQHPCETLTDNGALINEICAAAQLWSPATWSAKPVPANPGWEGNTWQGYTGVQSRPDHILLSADLTAPPVTIDFRSSHTLRGTVLASIDHAPLRLTMQYRFRVRKQREKPRRLDRAKLAAATTDLHFAKHFIEKWVQAIVSGGTPRPTLAIRGKCYYQSSVDGIPRRRLAKEALAEQRHDGSDYKEGGSGQVGSALVAASSVGCALLLHQRGSTQSGQTVAAHRQKHIFCMFYGLDFPAFS